MFQKNLFKEQLIKLMNGRNTTEFSEQTGFNRTYLSKYINLKLSKDPFILLFEFFCNITWNLSLSTNISK